jgi:hypothetical protein
MSDHSIPKGVIVMSNEKNELRTIEAQLLELDAQAEKSVKEATTAFNAVITLNAQMITEFQQYEGALNTAYSQYQDTKKDNPAKAGPALEQVKTLLEGPKATSLSYKADEYAYKIRDKIRTAVSAAKEATSIVQKFKSLLTQYMSIPEVGKDPAVSKRLSQMGPFKHDTQEHKIDELKKLEANIAVPLHAMELVSDKIAKAIPGEEKSVALGNDVEELFEKTFPKKHEDFNERERPKTKNPKMLDKETMEKYRLLAQAAKNTQASEQNKKELNKNIILPFLKENFETLSTQGLAESAVGNSLQAIIKKIDPDFVAEPPPVKRSASPTGVAEGPSSPKATDNPLRTFKTNLNAFMVEHKQTIPSNIKVSLEKLLGNVSMSIRKLDQLEAKSQLADKRKADDTPSIGPSSSNS